MYMLHASDNHTTHTINGIVCVVWLLDTCSIYIISILYPPIYMNWGYKNFFSLAPLANSRFVPPIMKFVAPPMIIIIITGRSTAEFSEVLILYV